VLLVRQHGAYARTCLGVSRKEIPKQLFRLPLLLREIGMCGERTTGW